MADRLQKVLANAGIASRRKVEEWIAEGRITVNGVLAQPGIKVEGNERIRLDGRDLRIPGKDDEIECKVLVYHKPEGEFCTRNDPEGRPTVFENLPRLRPGRWVSVGRLDVNTSGILLFTNDGELANKLMHPSSEIDREYAVRVLGEIDPELLKNMRAGVELEGGMAHFDMIKEAGGTGANHWYHVILREGRNRVVRRLWESQGIQVSRLIRIRYGSEGLPRDLRMGRFDYLPMASVNRLRRSVGLDDVRAKPGMKGRQVDDRTRRKMTSRRPHKR
ncbi:MAG: pseudouridine synthase [Gammaproteobacteria bacterium]|nr:pseudouridine synthase [Gammaproteobacteria bacterium]